MNPNPYDVMLLGLSFDIAGGWVLASGFMTKHIESVFRESRSTYGYNDALIKSALQQRADAWTGAVLLTFGFLMQMYAYFHGGLTAKTFGWIDGAARLAAAVVVVVVPISSALFFALRWNAKRTFARYDDQITNPSAPAIAPIAGDPEHLDVIARAMGASRLAGETDDDMAARLTRIRTEDAARKRERSERKG